MVTDYLSNAEKYYDLSEGIKKGLEYLVHTDFSQVEDGTYELDGRDVFVSIMSYQSKDSSRYEAHFKYLDIQYIIEGSGEIMGYLPIQAAGEISENLPERDICFYDEIGDAKETLVAVRQGMFTIFMPQDAHMPGLAWEEPENMRKAVVKVRVFD